MTKDLSNVIAFDKKANFDSLLNGVEIDKDFDGNTLLIWAASNGNDRAVEALLKRGAAVNTTGISGTSALLAAIQAREPVIAKQLVLNNADVNKPDNDGFTPLMAAAKYALIDLIKLLVNKGADVNAKDKNGCVALHWAAIGSSPNATYNELKNSGALEDIRNLHGETPIDYLENNEIR